MSLNDQRNSLWTPQSPVPRWKTGYSGSESYQDAACTQAGLDEISQRFGATVQKTRNVFAWVSSIGVERLSNEDWTSSSPTRWTQQLSEEKRSPAAEGQLGSHQMYCPGNKKLDPNHKFAKVVDELTRTAVWRFYEAKKSMDTCPEKCRTRSQLGSYQDSASAISVESDVPLVEDWEESAPRVWPCPFFVRYRESHLSCLKRHCLFSIMEVREHLCSVHLEPIYCAVCYSVFSTVKLRDDHMRIQACRHRLPIIFDGLRDSQVRELQRQGSVADKVPGLLQIRQWVKIWSVVFSCTQVPPLPLSFSEEQFRVYHFRPFWTRVGEDIIAEVLAKHGLQQYSIKDEERSLDALNILVANRAVDCLLPAKSSGVEI